MKIKPKSFSLILVAFAVLAMLLSSCRIDTKTDQEKLAEIVQDRFNDIDQFALKGRSLSLDDAEAYLYCWADKNSGMEISDEELIEAIWVVLESTDLIRELISEIDEIDVEYEFGTR